MLDPRVVAQHPPTADPHECHVMGRKQRMRRQVRNNRAEGVGQSVRGSLLITHHRFARPWPRVLQHEDRRRNSIPTPRAMIGAVTA